MTADVLVDYFGTGNLQPMIHPNAKISNVIGKIELPVINLDRAAIYTYDITIPEVISNIFLMIVGMPHVDYSFDKLTDTTWRISMAGYALMAGGGGQLCYKNPVTRQGINAYVLYGGIRG